MADKQSVRQLKIKSGTLKRNMKDYTSYKKEENSLQEKLAKMVEEGKDESDVKQQQQAINETVEVIAQCKPRIEAALDDMENVLATFDEQPGEPLTLLKETEEWQQAEALIAEAKAFVESIEL